MAKFETILASGLFKLWLCEIFGLLKSSSCQEEIKRRSDAGIRK